MENLNIKFEALSTLKKGLIIGAVFISFFALLDVASGEDTTSDTANNTTPVQDSAPKDKPAPAPKPAEPTDPLGKLWVAVDNSLNKRDGVDVSFDEGTGLAKVSLYSSEFLSEKALVAGAYSKYVDLSNEAYKIPEVKSVEYTINTDFTDAYGKNNKEEAVRIMLDKTAFNKFNWENMKGRPIHSQLRDEGTLFIHFGIAREIKLDEVTYF